ncbi:MAG TPA: hypothetical protein VFY23_06800 [Candidatus Limnocylindrales bacterium]|nr:hypothetical protein [Candidatus Limnocylindrales bacterium]
MHAFAAGTAALLGLAALLASAAPAVADCAVGDPGCVELEDTAASPGDRAGISGFGAAGCGEAAAFVDFVTGEYDPAATYVSVPLAVRVVAETVVASFVVPRISGGEYRLHLRCDADIAYGPSALLPGVFTVAPVPATDAPAPAGAAPSPPPGVLLAAAVVGFLAARLTRRAREPRPLP